MASEWEKLSDRASVELWEMKEKEERVVVIMGENVEEFVLSPKEALFLFDYLLRHMNTLQVWARL